MPAADAPFSLESVSVSAATAQVRVGEASGVVMEVAVRQGQEVKAGQLLARLNSHSQEFDLKMAQMAMNNEGSLGVVMGERNQHQASYQNAAEKYRRRQIEQWQMEYAQGALDRAKALVQSVEEQLRAAALVYEHRKREYDKRFIHSPFAGVVTEVKAAVGQSVGMAQHVFTIGNPNAAIVSFTVPADLAQGFSVDKQIALRDGSGKGTVHGYVTEIIDASADSRTVKMVVYGVAKDPSNLKYRLDLNALVAPAFEWE